MSQYTSWSPNQEGAASGTEPLERWKPLLPVLTYENLHPLGCWTPAEIKGGTVCVPRRLGDVSLGGWEAAGPRPRGIHRLPP